MHISTAGFDTDEDDMGDNCDSLYCSKLQDNCPSVSNSYLRILMEMPWGIIDS